MSAETRAILGRREKVMRDPVCGKKVVPASETLTEEYAGISYFFCSQSCLDRFNQDADIFTIGGPLGTLAGTQATQDRGLRRKSQNPTYTGHLTFETPSVDAGPG